MLVDGELLRTSEHREEDELVLTSPTRKENVSGKAKHSKGLNNKV